MATEYTIRTMRREEIDIAIEWAAEEGWNPGLHDAECYYAADPAGFLVGVLDGEPIATISAVNYGDVFGFIGFYIVKPGYRGKGYGIQIWRAAIERLKHVNIGLDGVIAQQNNYKRSGFELAYRNIRYEGRGGGNPPSDPRLVDLSTVPFHVIDAYDQAFFPAVRSPFTQAWIGQLGAHCLGLMEDDILKGYGVIRQCRNGFKIGPLFADSSNIAETLFLALRARVSPSESIYLDTPDVNPAAITLAEKYDMHVTFETARMYTKQAPELPLPQIFGVASFEVG